MITSSTNPKIAYVRDLIRKKKLRSIDQSFIAEGVRLVEEAVKYQMVPKMVLYSDDLSARGREMIYEFENERVPIFEVNDDLLARVSDTKHSQGIAAVFSMKSNPVPLDNSLVLIVDQVRDPGNLGTLLRTSKAAGVTSVIVLDGSVDVYSPKVVRSGMGAHFSLAIQTVSSSGLLDVLKKGSPVMLPKVCSTVVADGLSMWKYDFTQPCAVVVGGEANGVSSNVLGLTDQKITIPMMNKTESLNAGMAGSIVLFEVMRQRMQANGLE